MDEIRAFNLIKTLQRLVFFYLVHEMDRSHHQSVEPVSNEIISSGLLGSDMIQYCHISTYVAVIIMLH